MSHPGLTRGLVGSVIGFISAIVVLVVIRIVLSLTGSLGGPSDVLPMVVKPGATEPVLFTGPLIFMGGFGALFGWLWGVGSFSKYSTEHNGMEHALADETPGALEKLREAVQKATPGIIASARPMIRPLMLALGVCVVALVIFMAGSFVLTRLGSPFVMVTTENPTASTVTPNGSLNLGGLIINKTVFFVILSVVVLGILGGSAIVLALLVNGLSKQVEVAKQLPAGTEPPDSPLVRFTHWVFSLIEFFLKWVDDILQGAKQSIER